MDESESKETKTLSFGEALRFYGAFFRPYTRRLIWVMWLHVVEMMPHMIFPMITMLIVDYFIPLHSETSVYFSLVLVAGLLSIIFIHYVAYRVEFMRILTQVTYDLRSQIIRRLQMLTLSFHNRQNSGRYFSKITSDVERAQNFANTFVQSGLPIIGFFIFSAFTLAVVNWKLLLTFMCVIPVFRFILWAFRSRMRRVWHQQRLARENFNITVGNFLQASMLARMHGHEGFESKKVDTGNVQVTEKTVEAESQGGLFGGIAQAISTVFHFMVVCVCALYVMDGELTLGELLMFSSYLQTISGQVQQIMNLYPEFAQFSEALGSIQEITAAPDIEHNRGKRKIDHLEGRITFENVSFKYGVDSRRVLQNVSADIPPGTTVGLVGKSGSGKSTFVNLALGLYRTREGVVSIDNLPVDTLDMRSVRHFVGVVSQSPIIFSGTVYDNIVHAYRDTPIEDVVAAAKKANADEFISKMENGYDSKVGEDGSLLSGGQRQRVALARTILRNPAILILDEATSALDSESEKLVQDAIDRMDKKITKLIIAHRLSTVKDADIILVFRDGAIVERGNHAELMAQKGEYAKLVMMQEVG
jgi:ATP-binding cassette subfamily B protein